MYYSNENFVVNQGIYYSYFLIAASLYVLYALLDCMSVFDGGNDDGACCIPCDDDGNHELSFINKE